MLSESVLGPVWAFLFVSERPSIFGLIGGAIILSAVLLQFYTLLNNSKIIHWCGKKKPWDNDDKIWYKYYNQLIHS